MSGEWFHCGPCSLDFKDPYAPVEGDWVYGDCPECGRTVGRLTDEAHERQLAAAGGDA